MPDNLITAIIDGEEFRFWDSINISRNIATFDTFAFGSPYDPDNSLLKSVFLPLSFKPIEIKIDDELLLSGTVVSIDPSISDSNTVSISGYAKPGVLNDCSIPFDKYPIEYNNQTLEQIAQTIAGFFGLSTVFTEKSGAPFERVAAETGQKALGFLIALAKPRGFLISSTADGSLLFRKAATAGLTTTLKEGHTPLQSVEPQISPQQFYSSVTGLAPDILGIDFESVTINNPFMAGINRPFVYKVDVESEGADLQKAVKWKAGLMFAGAIKYTASVQGLRDEHGSLWQTNSFINLTSPSAMINKETTFLIESVDLNRGDGDSASLSLVLPESYQGEIPKTLPWL